MNNVLLILKWLDGKKTYICTLVCAATLVFRAQGWIDQQVSNMIIGVFGTSGVLALRAGIKKAEKK